MKNIIYTFIACCISSLSYAENSESTWRLIDRYGLTQTCIYAGITYSIGETLFIENSDNIVLQCVEDSDSSPTTIDVAKWERL